MRITLYLLLGCVWTSLASAQPVLRRETLGLPPNVSTIREAAGKVYHMSYMGLHVFEPSAGTWRYLGEQTRTLVDRSWVVHPDGRLVAGDTSGTVEYDASTGQVTEHNGVWFDVRSSDTIVCRIVSMWRPSASLIRCLWYRWPGMDLMREDSITTQADSVYDVAIPCSDGTVLALANTGVCRFGFDRAAEFEPLTDKIVSGRYDAYVDTERTHIVLHGTNGVMYSTDNFRSWSYVSTSVPTDSLRAIRCTSDPDGLYVVHSGIVERIGRLAADRDTVVRGLPVRFTNIAAVKDTIILGQPDTVILVRGADRTVISSGLPERSLRRMLAVPGGIIASGDVEVLAHRSGGEWERVENPIADPAVFIPLGGRSIDDFWGALGGGIVAMRPRGQVGLLAYPDAGYAARGAFVPASGTHVAHLNSEDGLACGSNQVVWSTNGSALPERTLLCRDDLRVFMVFNDSDHVALTPEGRGWRTVGGDLDRWEEIASPEFPSSGVLRTDVKGSHGLASRRGLVIWTHDAGRTWGQAPSQPSNVVCALAADGSFFVIRAPENSDTALVIERWVDGAATVVATFDVASEGADITLTEAAFDDAEQRLYIGTTNWTASLVVAVSSVHISDNDQHVPAPSMPLGFYDLFGRFVAERDEDLRTSGLYLQVTASGVMRVVVSR